MRPYEFMVRRAPPYMMTHPYSSDRVEALRQGIEQGSNVGATDSADNIRRFEMMQAKLIGFIRNQGQTLARYPTTDTSAPARYARTIAYYRVNSLPDAQRELEQPDRRRTAQCVLPGIDGSDSVRQRPRRGLHSVSPPLA